MIGNSKVKVFCVITDNLNYYRATDEPYITQSAITAQIRFLAS